MAMRPFTGYDMGDYFAHWLDMGKKIPHAPKIFHVNWFRTDDNGIPTSPSFTRLMRKDVRTYLKCSDTSSL